MQNYRICLLLFSLTVAITFVSSQNCSTILQNKTIFLQNDFNLTKYAGVWYEVRRNKTSSLIQGDCNRSNFTLISGTKERVNGSLTQTWNNHQIKTQQYGILNITTAGDTTGKLTFVNNATKNETSHWVLKTNYNYSLVYSCEDIGQKGEENIVILSRNKTINSASLKEAMDELKRYDASDAALKATNQTQECDALIGGVPAIGPSGIILVVHILTLTIFAKLY